MPQRLFKNYASVTGRKYLRLMLCGFCNLKRPCNARERRWSLFELKKVINTRLDVLLMCNNVPMNELKCWQSRSKSRRTRTLLVLVAWRMECLSGFSASVVKRAESSDIFVPQFRLCCAWECAFYKILILGANTRRVLGLVLHFLAPHTFSGLHLIVVIRNASYLLVIKFWDRFDRTLNSD